ncbi:MAG TPA: hypothetical protein VM659_14885 [Dongiaceae bacterium]|nr:hypothetical protein [Dongiaceae bacterium]
MLAGEIGSKMNLRAVISLLVGFAVFVTILALQDLPAIRRAMHMRKFLRWAVEAGWQQPVGQLISAARVTQVAIRSLILPRASGFPVAGLAEWDVR